MRFVGWMTLFIMLAGCGNGSKNELASHTVQPAEPTIALAALIDDTPIYIDDVDQGIVLKLYDLEHAIYQLRMQSLESIIEEKLSQRKTSTTNATLADQQVSKAQVDIILTPPARPRIQFPKNLNSSPALSRGALDAPVSLSVFCSYQSSHCSRLQPILIKVVDEYSAGIVIHYYDFPQRFHRYAYRAAKAVRCVSNQPRIWQFQDLLFSSFDNLDRASLLQKAQTLHLNVISFEQCLKSSQYNEAIDANITLANTIGIGKVPIVFVNGLYLPGPYSFASLQNVIEREMVSVGYKTATQEPLPVSVLPVTLLGTSVSSNAQESTALLAIDGDSPHFYLKGDELMEGVVLDVITYDNVIVNNQGDKEIILLWDNKESGDDANSEISQHDNTEQVDTELDDSATQTADSLHNKLPAPTATLSLSRQWIEDQLQDQDTLQTDIGYTEHIVEGYHLVKLASSELGEFYNTLGLKPDDVLMMVDGQWIHSGQNPMWDALRDNNVVKLVIIRKGLPVVYEYQVMGEGQ